MGAMKRLARTILFGLSLGLALGACGMGGTEVGNPRPGVPAAGVGGDEQAPTAGEITPSPSPNAIEFEPDQDIEAADLAE